jgi:hypothetical protein
LRKSSQSKPLPLPLLSIHLKRSIEEKATHLKNQVEIKFAKVLTCVLNFRTHQFQKACQVFQNIALSKT